MRNLLRSAARLTLCATLTAGAVLTGTGGAAAATGEDCSGWMMLWVENPSFEAGASPTQPVTMWCDEGPDETGVDVDQNWAHSGRNNGYIEATSTAQWNALSQSFIVPNGRTVEVSAYVATSPNVEWSYIGIRDPSTGLDYARRWIGAVGGRQPDGTVRYEPVSVRFRPNRPVPVNTAVVYTVFVGYQSPGGYSELMVDDVRTATVD